MGKTSQKNLTNRKNKSILDLMGFHEVTLKCHNFSDFVTTSSSVTS